MIARTLIFTGDGKGKTTAALGMAVRAAGHGQRVLIVQFLKSNSETGELRGFGCLPKVEIVQMGCGFVPREDHPEFAAHRDAARQALEFAAKALKSAEYDLVVLDEVCGAISRKLIDEAPVLELLAWPERTACIVLTGRGAGPGLIAFADTVTEMRCVSHGFQQGLKAQEGVEF
jgi:cob(I)alamin adenosyltransferase